MDGKGGGGWSGKLSALLHVHRGSRASSRKSSRASDASDLSEIGSASAWLFPNLPLLLLSGATGTHEDLQAPTLTVSRPSPTAEQPSAASSSGSDSHGTVRLVHSRSFLAKITNTAQRILSLSNSQINRRQIKRKSICYIVRDCTFHTLDLILMSFSKSKSA